MPKKCKIYNDISMICTLIFFWKQTSFYGWHYRYKPFHLSPTTPMMQKGITEDMEFSRTIYDFYNNKPPFLNFWKTKLPFLFLNFEKRNSLCQHFHARLPCFDKRKPMHDASFGWGKVSYRPLFHNGTSHENFKKQNSFYRIRWHSPLPWQSTESAV